MKKLKQLNKMLVGAGVRVFPRDLYANLRMAPVKMQGTVALAGTSGTITPLNETGNPEAVITATGSDGFVGYVFGFAVVVSPAIANVDAEIGNMLSSLYLQYTSAGVTRNIPAIAMANVNAAAPATVNLPAGGSHVLQYYRSPVPLEWDGTNASSRINLINTDTAATTANQAVDVIIDGWFAPKTEANLMPLFFPACADDDGNEDFLEQLLRAAQVLTAIRTGVVPAGGVLMQP